MRRLLLALLAACALAGTVIAQGTGLSELVSLKVQNEQLIEQNQQLSAVLRRQAIEKDVGCAIDWTAQVPVCKPMPQP